MGPRYTVLVELGLKKFASGAKTPGVRAAQRNLEQQRAACAMVEEEKKTTCGRLKNIQVGR